MAALEDVHWTSQDGVRRYPARGQMNHRHIHNTMRLLEARITSDCARLRLHMSDIWRALRRGLELPDPGEYGNQDPNWRLGEHWEEYTPEHHSAYSDWAMRRAANG